VLRRGRGGRGREESLPERLLPLLVVVETSGHLPLLFSAVADELQLEDTKRELQSVGEGVDDEAAGGHHPPPAALGVVVLSERRALQAVAF